MIRILGLEQRSEWLPALLENLAHYDDLIDSPSLVVNQLLKGDLVAFEVNEELIGLGKRVLVGNSYIFFVYHAYGANIRGNLKEIVEYVKQELSCDRLEFMCQSEAHVRLYESAVNLMGCKDIKKDFYFRLTI